MTHEHDLALLLADLLRAVERTGVLLAQATELQRELIDLHGEITSAAIDLHQMVDGMNASQPS